jgi:large subunit ribosomal protein L18
MESSLRKKHCNRKKRALRVRDSVRGTSEKPRLCVIKSNKHIHVQLIDDEKHVTVVSTSTASKTFRETKFNKKNKEAAKQLGLHLAKEAVAKNLKKVVFDRGPFKFHGVVATVAEGIREGGMEV